MGKSFANSAPDKWLKSKKYKGLIQVNNNKITQSHEKIGRGPE